MYGFIIGYKLNCIMYGFIIGYKLNCIIYGFIIGFIIGYKLRMGEEERIGSSNRRAGMEEYFVTLIAKNRRGQSAAANSTHPPFRVKGNNIIIYKAELEG